MDMFLGGFKNDPLIETLVNCWIKRLAYYYISTLDVFLNTHLDSSLGWLGVHTTGYMSI